MKKQAKKYIFGNWKLNPATLSQAKKLAQSIKKTAKYEVVLFPPDIFLTSVKYPSLGAQNCFWEAQGAFTGQISAIQLKSLKVTYCLVGHSEVRGLYGTNDMTALICSALLKQKITPVLCVGFATKASDSDQEVAAIVTEQIKVVADTCDISKIIIAYEPVWSISKGDPKQTKRIETPDHAALIIQEIKKKYSPKAFLYGGSISSLNAKDYLINPEINGLLIGGASLKPKEFNSIISI